MEQEQPAWWHRAKCLGLDPAIFYPDKGGASYEESRQAKAICNGHDGAPVCPVRAQCLEYALVAGERFGVWGGKSDRERRRLQRRRVRAALGAPYTEADEEDEAPKRKPGRPKKVG